jgi:hypothetical protein
LAGVHIGSADQPLLTVDQADLTFAIRSLLRFQATPAHIRLVRPALEVPLGARPPASSPSPHARETSAPILAALLAGLPLDVVDGTLLFRRLDRSPTTIERIEGAITPADGAMRVAFTGTFADAPLTAEGTVQSGLPTTAAPASDRRLAITVAGREVSLAALPFMSGRASGRAALRVRVMGTADDLRFDGRVLTGRGHIIGWNALRAIASGSRAEPRPPLALPPDLAGIELPFDEVRAAFAWRHGVWRIRRVVATTGELVNGASVRIDPTGKLAGSGSVRLPAAISASIANDDPALAERRDVDGRVTIPVTISGTVNVPRFFITRR